MADWYLAERARSGMGTRGAIRDVAEAVFGAETTARLARQVGIARANARTRMSHSGRRSRHALDMLESAYRGERCVIIGNGPSLNRTDLELLRNQHTFGLNRLYLLFEQLGFATEFHVVVKSAGRRAGGR